MEATVLDSPQAVSMSVFVVRAFIQKRLAEIDRTLLQHDTALLDLYEKLLPLLPPPRGLAQAPNQLPVEGEIVMPAGTSF